MPMFRCWCHMIWAPLQPTLHSIKYSKNILKVISSPMRKPLTNWLAVPANQYLLVGRKDSRRLLRTGGTRSKHPKLSKTNVIPVQRVWARLLAGPLVDRWFLPSINGLGRRRRGHRCLDHPRAQVQTAAVGGGTDGDDQSVWGTSSATPSNCIYMYHVEFAEDRY